LPHGPPLVAGSMRRFRTIGNGGGPFVPSSSIASTLRCLG
jgi:hypothetical protein